MIYADIYSYICKHYAHLIIDFIISMNSIMINDGELIFFWSRWFMPSRWLADNYENYWKYLVTYRWTGLNTYKLFKPLILDQKLSQKKAGQIEWMLDLLTKNNNE